ncbi:MAG: chromosomal replication initiator protein DnaA [Desulfobacterales bacterium]|uniref:Chromosomal replication initiator protein DnaA n=1 Tax=Candidatus Desulfatibia vada TaxID=2841696 RepID=A0A8J6NPR9_9BACT|nr:chromosomal replication initiator protein DnaA [Candidatus Desulfatibia vada]MBL6972110.1 chromosomal replication initiator protein DnaA [Desulfobacterales bacterium]
MESIWKEVKTAVRLRIPGHSFRMWIEPLEFKKGMQDAIILACPNDFSKKRVLDHYAKLIESEIQRAAGKPCGFTVEVAEQKNSAKSVKDQDLQLPLPNINMRPHNGRFLKKDFTFDQFVVGGNNDFAYSASLSLASRRNSRQNSLFLLSKTGMGKSHLSQAISHYILSEHPSERVYYMTAEDFSNEMVQAFRHDSINKFKARYRNGCDVLLLEDVHYLSGKERTQIELALTLDTLFESGKKIIFSSCYLPVDIPKLDDKLQSRLSSSLISNIEPPDFRTRIRILQKKALHNGYEMPEDVMQYLAGELTEDVRQLESGLIGVTAKSSLLGTPIDLALAESVVKNIVRQRKKITIDVIKKLVCKYYSISMDQIVSSSRKQFIVRPRQIAIYLSRMYTDAPLQAIGKSFNRYHATALHSINTVEQAVKQNSPVQKQVEFLRLKLESGKF